MRRPGLLLAIALLAGCQAGTGSSAGGLAPTASPAAAMATTRSPWLVLDLASGRTTPHPAVGDLAANPAYRAGLVPLRLLADTTATVGSPPGSLAAQADEMPGLARPAPVYLAALELTRAQWRLIAGTAPWESLDPVVRPAEGDDLPATGLSMAEAAGALQGWNARHGTAALVLPTAVEWEAAARAGTATAFPWGDDTRIAVVRLHAVTWETAADAPAPRPVGGRLANPLGLHDVCGNAAELVADGSARGGGWADPLSLARPANRWLVEPDTGHAQVGVRLVYLP